MEQVYHQVTLSMILLKCVGGFLFLLGTAYLIVKRPEHLPNGKNVLGNGSIFGLLNAGLVIILGKLAFFISTSSLNTGKSIFWDFQ